MVAPLIPSRKSIVASQKIKKGDYLTENNLTTKRPSTGRSPMMWDDLIGSIAERDYKIDDIV